MSAAQTMLHRRPRGNTMPGSMPARHIGSRPLRAGIVGGGRGAFIGAAHRMAVELDGQARIVAGAMSATAAIAQESAAAWFLERSYDSYESMARTEAAREDGIDFVIIATPNHLHLPVATAFLDAGIHVVCDKPLALTREECERLAGLVERGKLLFALTHTYSGYPAVRHAREMVREGALGKLRKVHVEYLQDWLMTPLERSGNKQAEWRTDPARAGLAGCVADIGTHAQHLLEYVTGARIDAVCADLSSFVDGRALDDDASILLRLEGGAKGTLVCSQVCAGEENAFSLRIYGDRAGLEWRQEEPNTLLFKLAGAPWQRLRVGHAYMSGAAKTGTRLPAGHPEGYIEAFANLYRLIVADVRRALDGAPLTGGYPDVRDGLRGLAFVERAVASAAAGAAWVSLSD
jgi:predicted dehydrogenase